MKVGQIVECNFGQYRPDARGKYHVDGHMPPEMIKNRLALLFNVRLGKGCIVVPISATHDIDKERRGYHVKIHPKWVPETIFWTPCDRWAKAELVQFVSASRVFTMRDDKNNYIKKLLPQDLVADIQRAVMAAVGGTGLLRAGKALHRISDRSEIDGATPDMRISGPLKG